jgi:hypothetical protein
LAGFFPGVRADAQPKARPRGALTQLGLSYAQDASITAHLAAFLSRHQFVPTKVLFNGGPMKSPVLRGRLLETLRSWVGSELSELPFADYDLAVARGAAVYARAKAGRGVRIRSATAQAYYVGIESNAPTIPGFEPPVELVCIAPFGMEEGAQTEVASRVTVGLVVGEPVQFRFFSSSTRRADVAGTVVSEHANDVVELAPIEVTLPASGRPVGSVVPVSLGAGISEIGLLELFATPRNPTAPGEQFKVELSVRDGR